MTNKEILQKSVKKTGLDVRDWTVDSNPKWWFMDNHYYLIVFSHDFAKAFWGEGKVCENCGLGNKWSTGITYSECCQFWTSTKGKPNWQYHLQQMVLEEEPLKYLERFIQE